MKATQKVTAGMYRVLQIVHGAGEPVTFEHIGRAFGENPAPESIDEAFKARLIAHPPKLHGDDAGKPDEGLLQLTGIGRGILANGRAQAIADANGLIAGRKKVLRDKRSDETDRDAIKDEVARLERFRDAIDGGEAVELEEQDTDAIVRTGVGGCTVKKKRTKKAPAQPVEVA